MASTSLFFDIFGRDNGVGKTFDNISDKGKGMSGVLKGVGTALSAGLVGIGAAVLKTGFGEVSDWSAGVKQLEAGLKSTGGAAHTTVDGMEALASSIQDYSGQTDDSIVASENLLLTFTNIRNVGPNKIFDDATVAASNMAAKMGGDAASQSILLGKALNDPVKGLTALTRVGVSFSAGQVSQIKAMQSSGNIMGAQKIILGELNKEFGGAAKAAGESLPGQLAKSHRAFEDLSQGLVTALLPALLAGAKLMTGVAKWASQNQSLVLILAAAVGVLAVAFIVLSAAAAIAASPFIWIGLAITALVVGIVIAYNKLGWFKDGVNAVFGFVKTLITNVVNFIVTYMVPIWIAEFNIIATVVRWIWNNVITPAFNGIKNIIGHVVDFITGTVVPGFKNSAKWIADAITGAVSGFTKFRDGVSSAIGKAIDFVTGIPGKIKGVFYGAETWLLDIGASIMQGLADGLTNAWHKVTDFVGTIGQWIKDHKGPISVDRVLLKPAGEAIMTGLHEALRAGMPPITNTLGGFTASLGNVGNLHSPSSAMVRRQLAGTGTGTGGSAGGVNVQVFIGDEEFKGHIKVIADKSAGDAITNANNDLGRRPSR